MVDRAPTICHLQRIWAVDYPAECAKQCGQSRGELSLWICTIESLTGLASSFTPGCNGEMTLGLILYTGQVVNLVPGSSTLFMS